MSFLEFHPQPKVNVGSTSGQSKSVAVGAASTSLTLEASKVYRLVSNTDCYIRFSKGAAAATSADIFLPSRTPWLVISDIWDTVSVIRDTASGTLGAVEMNSPA